jgi:hypothetical protein
MYFPFYYLWQIYMALLWKECYKEIKVTVLYWYALNSELRDYAGVKSKQERKWTVLEKCHHLFLRKEEITLNTQQVCLFLLLWEKDECLSGISCLSILPPICPHRPVRLSAPKPILVFGKILLKNSVVICTECRTISEKSSIPIREILRIAVKCNCIAKNISESWGLKSC